MVFKRHLSWLVIVLLLVAVFPVLAQDATDEPSAELPDLVLAQRTGFTPEGIEWDAANGRFLTGSLTEGTIFEVSDDGTVTPFIEDENFLATVGIEIDEANNRLLVTNTDPAAMGGLQGSAALGIYDLTTGELLHWVDLGAVSPDARSFFVNDVAVDDQGNAYVTNSFAPIIYKVDMDGNASIFVEDERLASQGFGLNGIEFHPHGYLIAGVSTEALLFKIPLDDPSAMTQIEVAQPVSADGIVLDANGDLIVVDSPTASVLRLHSEDEWETATVTGTSPNHMATTAAIRDGEAYVIYAHFEGMGGQVEVNEYEIVRVVFEDAA